MTSWFDINDIPVSESEMDDPPGLEESCALLHKTIEGLEARGISSDRIMLGGFSQGGAVSLRAAPSYSKPLAGAVSLSGWLTRRDAKFASNAASKANAGRLPIFQGHGEMDQVVLTSLGKLSVDVLKQRGFTDVTFKTYPYVPHSSCPQEMRDLTDWLLEKLPA